MTQVRWLFTLLLLFVALGLGYVITLGALHR
jgi:hypothetical protein